MNRTRLEDLLYSYGCDYIYSIERYGYTYQAYCADYAGNVRYYMLDAYTGEIIDTDIVDRYDY